MVVASLGIDARVVEILGLALMSVLTAAVWASGDILPTPRDFLYFWKSIRIKE